MWVSSASLHGSSRGVSVGDELRLIGAHEYDKRPQ